MDTQQAKIEIARELGFKVVGVYIWHSKMPGCVASLLPSTGTPEERLCALVDNIEAALTFPEGRLKIGGCKGRWKVGFEWAIGKLPETVRQEHAANSYASRLEATVAALELADRLRAAAPKNRWGLRAEDAVVYFPSVLELAVSRCGGEYHEGAWWLETEDRPGEVELADLSARLDAQLRAGDIVFDAVEHEGRWYVKRNIGGFEPVRLNEVFEKHKHKGAIPWFVGRDPPDTCVAYDTELEALVAALGYAEECRSLQADSSAKVEAPPPSVTIDGLTVTPIEVNGRWYLKREPYEGRAPALRRWAAEYHKTHGVYAFFENAAATRAYKHQSFASREEALVFLIDVKAQIEESESGRVSTPEERAPDKHTSVAERGKRIHEAVEASIAAQMKKAFTGRIRITIGGEEIQPSSYVESNWAKPSDAPSKRIHEAVEAELRKIYEPKTDEGTIMTANTTALATITELALPGLLRGALITVQRELVELAIPVVRRVARVEIKAWHRFAAAFSPKIKARLQLDRQIANLVVSVLVPCALYEAACRIEWIRKNENVMAFLRASIDAGCTEAGRLLAEPGLAFAKDGLTMLTRAVKEEKRRGELRAASSRLLEDMTGRDGRVVTEAEREVIELARSIGGVG